MGQETTVYIEEPIADTRAWRVPTALLRERHGRPILWSAISVSRSSPLTRLLVGDESPFTVSVGPPSDPSELLSGMLSHYLRRPDGTVSTLPLDELAAFGWREVELLCSQRVEAQYAHHFEDGQLSRSLLESRFRGTPLEDPILKRWLVPLEPVPIDWTSTTAPAYTDDTRPGAFELRRLPPDHIVWVTMKVPLSHFLPDETLQALDSLGQYPRGSRAIVCVDGVW